MINVPSSTQNITGFFIMSRGFSLIKDSLIDSLTSAGSNNGICFFILLDIVVRFRSYIEKYSANGPRVNAGKKDNAAMMIMTDSKTATNAGL